MYIVRRHSRRLFFPAGLLALAWLLCLGGALLAARPELRHRYGVLQVNVPVLPRLGAPASANWLTAQAPAAQLDTMTTWHTVRFTGKARPDERSSRAAAVVAQQLKAAPNHPRGLRILFESNSQYRSLVAMLNMFDTVGINKCWLDVQHQPVTLYAYTRPLPDWFPPGPVWLCGTAAVRPIAAPTPLLTELRQDLRQLTSAGVWRPLFGPYWRYSAVLLLLLPLAAAWQLRRLRSANFVR